MKVKNKKTKLNNREGEQEPAPLLNSEFKVDLGGSSPRRQLGERDDNILRNEKFAKNESIENISVGASMTDDSGKTRANSDIRLSLPGSLISSVQHSQTNS